MIIPYKPDFAALAEPPPFKELLQIFNVREGMSRRLRIERCL